MIIVFYGLPFSRRFLLAICHVKRDIIVAVDRGASNFTSTGSAREKVINVRSREDCAGHGKVKIRLIAIDPA